MLNGCPQTWTHHEISRSSRHGRYLGYLWYDRGCHHRSEKYKSNNLVPANNEYKPNAAYAHLASGLCCGFSSLVIFLFMKGCRTGHRYRRRRRCESECATGQDLRRNDSYSHLWLSLGLVWSHRFPHLDFSRLIWTNFQHKSDCSIKYFVNLSFFQCFIRFLTSSELHWMHYFVILVTFFR